MEFSTTNPASGEVIKKYQYSTSQNISDALRLAEEQQKEWFGLPLLERLDKVKKMADLLRNKKAELAKLATLEMGKLSSEAEAEVEKCAWLCDLYAEKSEEWLTPEELEGDGLDHQEILLPLGTLLAIMPWNFPYWQVFRFAIPSLIVGNVAILKHSNKVPGCAMAIDELFKEADFLPGCFQTLLLDHASTEKLIAEDSVRGVSFTGSTEAGARVAAVAGQSLKKVLLELGGSDPFVVLEDADIDKAAKAGAFGRLLNGGQSCIAAKRFIVHKDIADTFIEKLKKYVSQSKLPPLVDSNAKTEMIEFTKDAIDQGAKLICGGEPSTEKGAYFPGTVLSNINPNMRVWKEEVFGPIAPVCIVDSEEEALTIANDTEFGLGGSVWSKDLKRAEEFAQKLECGSAFVNSIVKSDPRIPFGGIKNSGWGRELSTHGLKEFANIKTINVYK